MEANAQDPRTQRGLALAKAKGEQITVIVADKYLVPSATHSGGYIVDVSAESCTCPDWQSHGPHTPHRCKHLIATLVIRREIALPDGNSVVIEEKHNVNYPRDWYATNWARTAIPRLAPALLADLIDGLPCLNVPKPPKRGRASVPEKAILLTAALRAFEDMTAGAAVVAAENYKALGIVNMSRIPSYNTLLREFAKPKYMPMLHQLIAGSAMPLIPLETTFIVDGTGFGSSRYDCHFVQKHCPASQHRPPTPRHRWVQATIVFGRHTHVIPAVQITEPNVSETKLMVELLKRVQANGGDVREWLADAIYLAWYNIEALETLAPEAGIYIDFPPGVTGRTRPAVARLYKKMQADPEDYKRHYDQRVLGETGMSMIKTRFSHWLRSRVPQAQYAEAMLRCVCHNVACLVQAIEELNIDPKYWAPSSFITTPTLGGTQ